MVDLPGGRLVAANGGLIRRTGHDSEDPVEHRPSLWSGQVHGFHMFDAQNSQGRGTTGLVCVEERGHPTGLAWPCYPRNHDDLQACVYNFMNVFYGMKRSGELGSVTNMLVEGL